MVKSVCLSDCFFNDLLFFSIFDPFRPSSSSFLNLFLFCLDNFNLLCQLIVFAHNILEKSFFHIKLQSHITYPKIWQEFRTNQRNCLLFPQSYRQYNISNNREIVRAPLHKLSIMNLQNMLLKIHFVSQPLIAATVVNYWWVALPDLCSHVG